MPQTSNAFTDFLTQQVRAFEREGFSRPDAARALISLCISAFAAREGWVDAEVWLRSLGENGVEDRGSVEKRLLPAELAAALQTVWRTRGSVELPASIRQRLTLAATALLPRTPPPVEDTSTTSGEASPPSGVDASARTRDEPSLRARRDEAASESSAVASTFVNLDPWLALDWRQLDLALLGGLWERSLLPTDRRRRGVHYTPRADVERLVLPTVMQPLRDAWEAACDASSVLERQQKMQEAAETLWAFQHSLSELRVLDPACGAGNFLYVTMEHVLRLEHEVFCARRRFYSDDEACWQGLERVHPSQFQGIELDPRSAGIAELSLWFRWLQTRLRLWGGVEGGGVAEAPASLERLASVRCEDALLKGGLAGLASRSTPLPTPWPPSHYIIGNPPFLGVRHIHDALGRPYVEALRACYPDIAEHSDLVMYWWARAAKEVGEGRAHQFGLITTNAIWQPFSRKVVDQALATYPQLEVREVVANQPWTHAGDGASVRVTMMTVGRREHDEASRPAASLASQLLALPKTPLPENQGLACVGYQLSGKGFVLTPEEASAFVAEDARLAKRIRPLLSGRDLMQSTRGLYAVDLFGLSEEAFRTEHPSLFEWLEARVRPERERNARRSLRERWWLFGEARSTFRPALVGRERVWVTSLTAKHRVFASVPADWICDSTTVMFAIDDAQAAILSSRLHTAWSFVAGGTLEDRPRYNKSTCFETYPFPSLRPPHSKQLASIVRQIDTLRWSWRNRQNSLHTHELTMTRAYNRLNDVGLEAPMADGGAEELTTPTENAAIQRLSDLHAALDRAVFAAYGWDDVAEALVGRSGATTPLVEMGAAQRRAEAELLKRLAALARTQGE